LCKKAKEYLVKYSKSCEFSSAFSGEMEMRDDVLNAERYLFDDLDINQNIS
jgi:hypothetical protein